MITTPGLHFTAQEQIRLLTEQLEALQAKHEAVVKEFNERLVDRTTGMLDSLAKPRLSAASFRAGWEASMDFASGGTSNLEQSLQQHLDPKTTDL